MDQRSRLSIAGRCHRSDALRTPWGEAQEVTEGDPRQGWNVSWGLGMSAGKPPMNRQAPEHLQSVTTTTAFLIDTDRSKRRKGGNSVLNSGCR